MKLSRLVARVGSLSSIVMRILGIAKSTNTSTKNTQVLRGIYLWCNTDRVIRMNRQTI